ALPKTTTRDDRGGGTLDSENVSRSDLRGSAPPRDAFDRAFPSGRFPKEDDCWRHGVGSGGIGPNAGRIRAVACTSVRFRGKADSIFQEASKPTHNAIGE